jgi:hypothetical protein
VTSVDFGSAEGPHRFAVDVDDAALTKWVIQTIANSPDCLAGHGNPPEV